MFFLFVICDAGACDYLTYRNAVDQLGVAPFISMQKDESCVSWHTANAPTTKSACNDPGHVIRNHVTTPFLIRMGLTDESLSPQLVAAGFTVPDAGLMTPATFARLIQQQLRALGTLQTTAEEGSAIATAPAVFAPTCKHHETLTEALVYQVEIDAGMKLLDVAQNWFTGGSPTVVVANSPADNFCPP